MVAQVSRSTRKPARKITPGTKSKLADSLAKTAKTEITQEKKATLLGERQEEFLQISQLVRNAGLQPRSQINQATVDDYAEKLEAGIKFPPVTVFYDGQNHYLADGYHRVASHEQVKREQVAVDIKPGSLDDAKWYSYSVNADHGLPRSSEDKRRAIESALTHPNAAKMNDSELARYLKVAPKTIKKYKEELNIAKPEKRTVTRTNKNGEKITYEQTVNSSARSKAQKEKAKPQQEFHNKYEFWEQPGEWEIPIPGDLLSNKVNVSFRFLDDETPRVYKFIFSDQKKSLFVDNSEILISEEEEKEYATPFLYAQGKIKEWVDEKGQEQKKYFEALDAGFHSGIRVQHEKYGQGRVVTVQQKKGMIEVKFDSDRFVVLDKTELAIITPIEFSVGETVRAKAFIGWPNNDLVQIVEKQKSGAYLVKEIGGKTNRKGEDTSKTAVIEWWDLTREVDKTSASPNIKAKIEDAPSENLNVEVIEKIIDTDYYLIAIGCLPNLSENDLLQLKSAIDREIKIRNIEVVDDIKGFQQALIKYAASQGKNSPEAWAHKVIQNHLKGEISPLWDDYIKGIPLGSSSQIKRDWEVEPGMPYTAFKEERIQYWIAKGEPIESASMKAGQDLRNPLLAKDLWEGFLRKSNRIADEALKAKEMGVAPYLPPSFNAKEPITKESVMVKLEQLSEQHSLPESDNGLTDKPIKPPIEQLQKCLAMPATKGIAILRIKDNPEWGYQVVDGKVVESSSSNDSVSVIELATQIPYLIAVIKHGQNRYYAISEYKGKYNIAKYRDGSFKRTELTHSKEEIEEFYAEVWINPEIIFGSLEEKSNG